MRRRKWWWGGKKREMGGCIELVRFLCISISLLKKSCFLSYSWCHGKVFLSHFFCSPKWRETRAVSWTDYLFAFFIEFYFTLCTLLLTLHFNQNTKSLLEIITSTPLLFFSGLRVCVSLNMCVRLIFFFSFLKKIILKWLSIQKTKRWAIIFKPNQFYSFYFSFGVLLVIKFWIIVF